MTANGCSRSRSLGTVLAVVLLSFAAFVLHAPTASADTYVFGDITTDEVWSASLSPYVLIGNVTVTAGVTLGIEEGATVRFDSGTRLYVEGRLDAFGSQSGPSFVITFESNTSGPGSPGLGIQFNTSSTGTVTGSFFTGLETGVVANGSSPDIAMNDFDNVGVGIELIKSSSSVTDNTINFASTGILMNNSDAQIMQNTISNVAEGIRAEAGGSPVIQDNTIFSLNGDPAVGIYIYSGPSPDIQNNIISDVVGSPGEPGVNPGDAGGQGGPAGGIFLLMASGGKVAGNDISSVQGGDGGPGAPDPPNPGGEGGPGGFAVGIGMDGSTGVTVEWNTVSSVRGGIGGDGGDSGGAGGEGGLAIGLQGSGSPNTLWRFNGADTINGGEGGQGGMGVSPGTGGEGGTAWGMLAEGCIDARLTGNTLDFVEGGRGGGVMAPVPGPGIAGRGADAWGVAVTDVAGNLTTITTNTVGSVTGGAGELGPNTGGDGGNATGIEVWGRPGGPANTTVATGNTVTTVTGGMGGGGGTTGGMGGPAMGITASHLFFDSASNSFSFIQGGDPGGSMSGNGSKAGDASGFVATQLPKGTSVGDTIDTVDPGSSTPPAQPGTGTGYVLDGVVARKTRLTVDNATIVGVQTRDFALYSYAYVTTVNTPFSDAGLLVQSPASMTVRNYLGIDALWPNGVTPVPGSRYVIEDGLVTVWDVVTQTGSEYWMLVTDRVYFNSPSATQNTTTATVIYPGYTWAFSPRSVDMFASHTETFIMIDEIAPTSAAGPLPPTSPASFPVDFTANDGNGTGLSIIELWYSKDGGPWSIDQTQAGAPAGSFTFTAGDGDGAYAFYTIAKDFEGNQELAPLVEDASTLVDMTPPESTVSPLAPVTFVSNFTVDWGPEPGTTDIDTYTIEYNRDGGGWQPWLVDTTLTSDTFTAVVDGLYEFRSIATDFYGNVETAPPGNDTWTLVDTGAPQSQVSTLSTWQTSLSFLVEWTGSSSVADYTIDVRDNGGPWNSWLVWTTLTSSTYTGVDGHTYAFRSIGRDGLGNTESPPLTNDTWTIVDVTAPSATVDALPTYTSTSSFTVSWSGPTDTASYRVDSRQDTGGWTTWIASTTGTSSTFTGSDGSTYDFRAFGTDFAGNAEPIAGGPEASTTVDTTLPASNVLPLSSYQTGLTFTVNWAPEPGVTDIATYRIDSRDNGGPWTTWIPSTASTSSPFAGVDGHAYEYRSIATDFAGNTETAPPSADASTTVDVTPPSTVGGLAGTLGGGGWYTTPVTVTLIATDATSGVSSTLFQVDGGSWTAYAAPFQLSDGIHSVMFYSVDNAGLGESPKSIGASVDTTPPVTSVSLSGTTGSNGWYTSPVTVNLTASDAGSGVASTTYRVDGGPWLTYAAPFPVTGDLAHTVEFQSTDVGGSVESLVSIPVKVDTSLPSSSVSLNGTTGSNGWYISGVTVTITGNDATSGVDAISYRLDGGTWQGYSSPFVVAGEGNRVLEAFVTDLAGLTSSIDTSTIKVDTLPPTTTASVSGTAGGGGWYLSTTTVTLTAADGGSGVASTSYRVDGGPWTTYGGSFSPGGEGTFNVEYRSTDNAGLVEPTGSTVVRVDLTPPSTSHDLAGTLGLNDWYKSVVNVTLSGTDAGSGVDAIFYKYEADPWVQYVAPFPTTDDGTETVQYYGVDVAGNVEIIRVVDILVDATPPVVVTMLPRGTDIGTDTTIEITFDDVIDMPSVESAFQIVPAVSGTFSWTSSRIVTFTPDVPLQPGTSYTVTVGATAHDRAGNTLTPATSQFVTVGTPSGPDIGVTLSDLILPIAVIAAAALLGGLIVARRAIAKRRDEDEQSSIDDVFVLYRRDGILIKHETRRLKPDVDSDILTGMLTAVQSFVKDTFRGEEGELDQMTFGAMNILLARGQYLVLASIVTGSETAEMSLQLQKCIVEMEELHGSELDEWDGDMALAKILRPYIRKLINGEYA